MSHHIEDLLCSEFPPPIFLLSLAFFVEGLTLEGVSSLSEKEMSSFSCHPHTLSCGVLSTCRDQYIIRLMTMGFPKAWMSQ